MKKLTAPAIEEEEEKKAKSNMTTSTLHIAKILADKMVVENQKKDKMMEAGAIGAVKTKTNAIMKNKREPSKDGKSASKPKQDREKDSRSNRTKGEEKNMPAIQRSDSRKRKEREQSVSTEEQSLRKHKRNKKAEAMESVVNESRDDKDGDPFPSLMILHHDPSRALKKRHSDQNRSPSLETSEAEEEMEPAMEISQEEKLGRPRQNLERWMDKHRAAVQKIRASADIKGPKHAREALHDYYCKQFRAHLSREDLKSLARDSGLQGLFERDEYERERNENGDDPAGAATAPVGVWLSKEGMVNAIAARMTSASRVAEKVLRHTFHARVQCQNRTNIATRRARLFSKQNPECAPAMRALAPFRIQELITLALACGLPELDPSLQHTSSSSYSPSTVATGDAVPRNEMEDFASCTPPFTGSKVRAHYTGESKPSLRERIARYVVAHLSPREFAQLLSSVFQHQLPSPSLAPSSSSSSSTLTSPQVLSAAKKSKARERVLSRSPSRESFRSVNGKVERKEKDRGVSNRHSKDVKNQSSEGIRNPSGIKGAGVRIHSQNDEYESKDHHHHHHHHDDDFPSKRQRKPRSISTVEDRSATIASPLGEATEPLQEDDDDAWANGVEGLCEKVTRCNDIYWRTADLFNLSDRTAVCRRRFYDSVSTLFRDMSSSTAQQDTNGTSPTLPMDFLVPLRILAETQDIHPNDKDHGGGGDEHIGDGMDNVAQSMERKKSEQDVIVIATNPVLKENGETTEKETSSKEIGSAMCVVKSFSDLMPHPEGENTKRDGLSVHVKSGEIIEEEEEIAATPLSRANKESVDVQIKIPVRGSTCTHLGCFDLSRHVQAGMSSADWSCPICSENARAEDLRIDYFLWNILANAPIHATHFIIHSLKVSESVESIFRTSYRIAERKG